MAQDFSWRRQIGRYEELYQRPYAPKGEQEALGRRVSTIVRGLGGVRSTEEPPARFSRGRKPGGGTPEQLTLV